MLLRNTLAYWKGLSRALSVALLDEQFRCSNLYGFILWHVIVPQDTDLNAI